MPSIELSAGPVHYTDSGGDGPVVVLVHGLLMDGRQWDPVVEELPTSMRCIRPTLPMGAHREPMRPDADLSLRGLGRLLGEFIEALDLNDITLAFSDWCGAQVMIADGHMDRVGGLVLVSCEAYDNYPPGLPGKVAGLAAWVPGGVRIARRGLLVKPLRYLPLTFGWMTKRRFPDELLRSWLSALADPAIRRDYRRYARDTRQGRADLLAATPALRNFDRPVLIVWAKDDKVMPPEHGARLAGDFPDATLIEVDDSYTLVPVDQPQVLAGHLQDFVSRRRPLATAGNP